MDSTPSLPADPFRSDELMDEVDLPAAMNRRERRAMVRRLPRMHAPIKRAMRGITTSADAIALAKSRGL